MADTKDAQTPQTLVPVILQAVQSPGFSQVDCEQYAISAGFSSPASNQPANYNNQVFVWEGGAAIPFQNSIVGSGPALGNRPDGSLQATPTGGGTFFTTDYVMVYSVGPASTATPPTYPNVAASVYIPGGVGSGLPMQYLTSDIGFVPGKTNSTMIAFTFAFPQGVNPSANGAWIGLWGGIQTNPYATPPTLGQVKIPNVGQAYGTVNMMGLTLAANSQYTAALYTSGYSTTPPTSAPTNVAAWLTFKLTVQQ